MDIGARCVRISNSYYNLGLKKAKLRNLSGAIPCLKKALQFNKNNKDARNLLGLIYFEIGETAQALTEWVISLNLNPSANDAERYLGILKKDSGKLESIEQQIIKYNQALIQAQNGNEDLAILQLSRICEQDPKYVKAALLLSLLLIKKEEYVKAGKAALKALNTDHNNAKGLFFMSIIKENTGRADIEKKKLKDAFSHRQVQDDDVIIPSGYTGYSGWQTAVNIGIGLLIGAASILFLYMPAKTAQLNNIHNNNISAISEKLNQANVNIDRLEKKNEELRLEADSLRDGANTAEEAVTYKLTQYQLLSGILDAYRSENYQRAADLYSMLDADELADVEDGSGVSVKQLYSEIAEKMNAEGHTLLLNYADSLATEGRYDEAIAYYDKSLKIKPDYAIAIYKKGLAYKGKGDVQTANTLFGEVIINYADSEAAELAKAERGY